MGETRRAEHDATPKAQPSGAPREHDTARAADGVRRGLSARWFAWLLSHGEGFDREMYGAWKRDLLGPLTGTVVEIGPGGGVNLPYYGAGIQWIGIEPNVHFHSRLRRKAATLGLDADVRPGLAERTNLPDASADAVVSTLVLCSVDDLDGALAEVRRVLKPGGIFVFIEHVAAPTASSLRRVQRFIKPFWGVIADGCRPDRETGRRIEAAGFTEVHFERFEAEMPLPVVRPHIAGTARKT